MLKRFGRSATDAGVPGCSQNRNFTHQPTQYNPMGAPGRTRTCGQPLRRRLLYPLSYGGSAITLANRKPTEGQAQADAGEAPSRFMWMAWCYRFSLSR